MRQSFRRCVDRSSRAADAPSPVSLVLLGLLLTTVLSLDASADTATVYQCTQPDGTVVFSGEPCGPDAKRLTIDAPSAGTGSESTMKGIEQMAHEYDEQQRLKAEAAARARATPPPVIEIVPQDQPVYVPSYSYAPYATPYDRYGLGWSIHGVHKDWHFDVGTGVRPPSHDVSRHPSPGSGTATPRPPHPTPSPVVPQSPAASGRLAAPPPSRPLGP